VQVDADPTDYIPPSCYNRVAQSITELAGGTFESVQDGAWATPAGNRSADGEAVTSADLGVDASLYVLSAAIAATLISTFS
jgi:hypothetical protein